MGAEDFFILTVQKDRPCNGLFLVTNKNTGCPPFLRTAHSFILTTLSKTYTLSF